MQYTLTDEAATRRLGHALARTAEPGDVLLLSGDLGTGKTTLVKGIAAGLGIDPDVVRSPSFTLMHPYDEGRLPLFHFDVYRLRDPGEFEAMGGMEPILAGDALVVIEWGEQVKAILPPEWLHVHLDYDTTPSGRRVHVHRSGPAGEAWYERLRRVVEEESLP